MNLDGAENKRAVALSQMFHAKAQEHTKKVEEKKISFEVAREGKNFLMYFHHVFWNGVLNANGISYLCFFINAR